jgi:hypothetical protein
MFINLIFKITKCSSEGDSWVVGFNVKLYVRFHWILFRQSEQNVKFWVVVFVVVLVVGIFEQWKTVDFKLVWLCRFNDLHLLGIYIGQCFKLLLLKLLIHTQILQIRLIVAHFPI